MEMLLAPLLAAVVLTVGPFPVLFGGTVAGFVAAALLIGTVRLPGRVGEGDPTVEPGIALRGLCAYLVTPRLAGPWRWRLPRPRPARRCWSTAW